MDPFNPPDPTNTPQTTESGEVSSTPVYDEAKYDGIFNNVQNLAVARLRYEVEDFAEKNDDMLLDAGTSSGKSVAYPIALREAQERLGQTDIGKIGLIEPRKETTKANATSIAQITKKLPREVDPGLAKGQDVGYQMRGDNKEGKHINVMTDGYLIEIIRQNPLLEGYWKLVFDERHEGNWNQDFGIAIVKEIINPKRIVAGLPPIGISFVSATMDVEEESAYLTGEKNKTKTFEIKLPREYEIHYDYLEAPLPKGVDYKDAVAAKIIEILDLDNGDIWAFLPGVQEIEQVKQRIEKILTERGRLAEFDVLPFHAQLEDDEDKEKVIRERLENEIKRIVLATTAGETGMTPKNKPRIVDSGLIKVPMIDPATGARRLVPIPHCQSGLEQRAGRGGREAEGYYYGIFTKDDRDHRPLYPQHEIERMDLTRAVLDMKGMGVPDIYTFNLPIKPEREKLDQAVMELRNLGILDEHGELTEEGEFISNLGLGPIRGRMVVEGMRNNCLEEMVKIAAALEIGSPFVEGKKENNNYRLHMAHQKYNLLQGTLEAGEAINPSSDLFRYLQAIEAFESHNRSSKWAASERAAASEWARGEFLLPKVLANSFKEYTEILGRLKEMGVPVTGPGNFSNPQGDPILAQQTKANAIAASVAPALVNNFMVATDDKKEKYTGLVKTKGEFGIDTISSVAPGRHKFITSIGSKSYDQGKDIKASICQGIEPEWIPKYLPQLCTITNQRITTDPVTGETIKTYKAVLNKPRMDLGTITEVVKPVKLPMSRRMKSEHPTATEWIPFRNSPNRATTTIRNPATTPPNPSRASATANPTNTVRTPATPPPNPITRRPPRGPITPAERFKLEGETNESRREAARMARSLAENAGFRPTPENRTILQKARNFWLKLQGKL